MKKIVHLYRKLCGHASGIQHENFNFLETSRHSVRTHTLLFSSKISDVFLILKIITGFLFVCFSRTLFLKSPSHMKHVLLKVFHSKV